MQRLQYLNATRDHKLEFTGKVETPEGLEKYSHDIERNCGFVAYSDSSWGNAVPYPMFGYGIYLYGGLISFASKQLKTVAHSSCEAEYQTAYWEMVHEKPLALLRSPRLCVCLFNFL